MENAAHWNNREAIVTLIKRLVKVPSISGTEQENVMANELISVLKEIPFFQKNPYLVFEKNLAGDPLNRKAVAALLRGKKGNSDKTVILLSHFDVVGVEDYGYLKNDAFDVDRYTEKLKAAILPQHIEEELQSGNWLFARGIMDMKAGLAVHIALLSEYGKDRDFEGNILLLSTPDEERYSEGMFAAVECLSELKQQHGLDYVLGICSEPSFASYPGDQSKYIYLGSVGKLLPLIFCNGKETHVGEPLEGINASWMAAVFTANMELSERFIEHIGEERNPPPTCLKLTDLKEQYSVQTPTHAYALYNVLTIRQTPAEVIEKLTVIAEESSAAIFSKMNKMYSHSKEELIDVIKPKVYTYSTLYKLGKERFGKGFETSLREMEAKVVTDYPLATVELAKKISSYFQDLAPFYLIMIAPPYYPHVSLQKDGGRDERIVAIAKRIIKEARVKHKEVLKLKQFFTGLSDVSYCRLLDAHQVIPSLVDEMPLYGKNYKLPLKEIQALDIPTINLGPYGKDAHKRTERLELDFSTEKLPELLKFALHSALNQS
ncbi:M20/M25/M40 family metallo-hydrolase [Peribacillus cavernae]|uniref:M20/M25/M40 family metallo-hydrolase n=1 Tax=Peribacillus cavernae TaxID=1674310 RepID=A0A3S0TWT7_9BACI|nr:M20/M25/M40 family metallo-hydrolase [Peribacillus cavernae]MDQ0220364.1 arginine utilization protein RocB [Peribacillus cavernae]RUQ25546.1 M20/M25/M40 family metallo-hydrolase [Peribacillus cavernae]